MRLVDLDELVMALPGVRRRSERGRTRWHYQGRLVARELDDTHVVVRVPFDVRDVLVRQDPQVFSIPPRFARHMMVVADLAAEPAEAVVEAVTSAWRFQCDEKSPT